MLNRTVATLATVAVTSNAQVNSEPTLITTGTSNHEVMNLYLRFVAEFGKQYASKEHMDERYEIFKDNYEKVLNHNSSVDEEGRPPSFEMGINQFSDLTEEEFMADRFGAKPPARLRSKKLQYWHRKSKRDEEEREIQAKLDAELKE